MRFRRLPFDLSPFPRGRWIWISPESPSVRSGIVFGSSEFPRLVVLHVSPGEAVTDHLQVDEAFALVNPSDLTVISVNVDHFDADRLSEDLGGQILSSFSSRMPGPFPARSSRRGGCGAVRSFHPGASVCLRRRSQRPFPSTCSVALLQTPGPWQSTGRCQPIGALECSRVTSLPSVHSIVVLGRFLGCPSHAALA